MTPLEDQKHNLQAEIESLQQDGIGGNSNHQFISGITDIGDLDKNRGAVESLIEPIEIDGENMDIDCDFV